MLNFLKLAYKHKGVDKSLPVILSQPYNPPAIKGVPEKKGDQAIKVTTGFTSDFLEDTPVYTEDGKSLFRVTPFTVDRPFTDYDADDWEQNPVLAQCCDKCPTILPVIDDI